ncbi:iron chaperone [Winogradskyella schleiferi]|uniref:iron chaperone n=1 Tax=Winogradskyella schleiferi TaxID=2686078 RepID=UPI0015BE7FC2|nr:DUF1801 domain-containing protein [Winogradskyella schleiferi]
MADKAKAIDAYISRFPADKQEILKNVRDVIRKAAPNAEEIINYDIPTFVLHGNLVHFGGFKKHLGFYPTPSGISEFTNELSEYITAKGSVKFLYTKPIPYELIGKITQFRVKEQLEE